MDSFKDLQSQETFGEFDKKREEIMNTFKNEDIKKVFSFYAEKVRKTSTAALQKMGLNDTVVSSNIAESINSVLKRERPKDNLFADEMVTYLFFLTNEYRCDLIQGYYNTGNWRLTSKYSNKIMGSRKEVFNVLLFCPNLF